MRLPARRVRGRKKPYEEFEWTTQLKPIEKPG